MIMTLFPPEFTAALEQPGVRLMYAVRLDWPDSVVRLHSGIGTFNHFPFDDGEAYSGVGSLGKIGNIQFGDGDETTPSVTLELSVLDEPLRAEILKGGYQGRQAEMYTLIMGPQGDILSYALIFDGVMDSAALTQGSTNAISLPLMAADDAYDVGFNWRCTNESHQAKFPNDSMYKYAEFMEDFAIYFGNDKDGIPLRKVAG